MALCIYRPEFKSGIMKIDYKVGADKKRLNLTPSDLEKDLSLSPPEEAALKASDWGKYCLTPSEKDDAKAERKLARQEKRVHKGLGRGKKK